MELIASITFGNLAVFGVLKPSVGIEIRGATQWYRGGTLRRRASIYSNI